MGEKIIGNSFGHDFSQSVDTLGAIGKQILRPSYLKIRLNILIRFLDHIQENIYGSDTKIVWTVQVFHGCEDTSIR